MAKKWTKDPEEVCRELEPKNQELQEKDVTVFMLDIRGCTTLCENLSHADMNYIIERYFSAFLVDIHCNHGDMNETMGDGLMAIYTDEGAI